MKTITFNNKKYQAPECWCDITIRMTMEVSKLDKLIPDAPLITIISSYTGIPVRELTTSKKDEVNEIIDILSFIYTAYTPTPRYEFEFKGEKFLCESDMMQQKFGDWVSLQTIIYKNKENPVDGLARMIAVLCKKEGESIDDLNVDEREEYFKDLPLTIAKDVESFFLHSQIAYKAISQLYLVEEEQKKSILLQLKELKNIMKLRKAQSGMFSRTRLLIGYYQIYLWYLTGLLEKSFNSQHTDNSKKTLRQTLKKLSPSRMIKRKSEL